MPARLTTLCCVVHVQVVNGACRRSKSLAPKQVVSWPPPGGLAPARLNHQILTSWQARSQPTIPGHTSLRFSDIKGLRNVAAPSLRPQYSTEARVVVVPCQGQLKACEARELKTSCASPANRDASESERHNTTPAVSSPASVLLAPSRFSLAQK